MLLLAGAFGSGLGKHGITKRRARWTGCCGGNILLQRAKMSQNQLSKLGNTCSASARIARVGFHQGLLPAAIHDIDQHPRTAITHPHRPPCRRNRAIANNRVQQISFSRPHCDFIATIKLNLDFKGS